MRRMARILDRLAVVWEDAAMIAVNKPSSMLSVPGRELRVTESSLSRTDEWRRAVQHFAESTPLSSADYELAQLLKGRGVEIPRSETKFCNFMKRIAKEERDYSSLWRSICATDRSMNKIDLSTLPAQLVSAADLVEVHCGHRVMIVHRLDQETSGLLVFAKNDRSAASLAEQFRSRSVEKTYLAKVRGRVLVSQGSVDLPLSADAECRPKQKVDLVDGKPSLTHYRVISPHHELYTTCQALFRQGSARGEFSFVELNPVNGRCVADPYSFLPFAEIGVVSV